ncbi:hypothetical protein [Oceanicaulis sp.]|uniref:hypothetical protein n=1 Tax=Oceanicaulis sp. TaxID=1924941 RepID=UPI003BAB65BB
MNEQSLRNTIETQDRPITNNLLGFNRGRSEDADEVMDTEIDRKTHQIVDRLTDAYYRASACFDAYLHFRQTRGRMFEEALPRDKWINRSATYPESHIMHFSILAGMVLVEGLINAYFFSKSSDLGLLGGWIQAITVAFTNVITAFFLIGFLGLRLLQNPDRPFSFAAAIIGTPLALGFVVFLNYTAALYRDLLEVNAATLALGDLAEPTGAILAPVSSAMAGTGIQTLEGLLLFGLGVTFAAIAAFKGATFDDRLIGYGTAQRRAINAAAHLSGVLKQLPHTHRENTESAVEIEESLSGPTRREAIALKRKIDKFFAADNSRSIQLYEQAADTDLTDTAETSGSDKPPFPAR